MSEFAAESRENLSQTVPDANGVAGWSGTGGRGSGLGRLQVSPEALRTLPADFVKRHRILPLKISDGTLHIATATPGNQRVIDDIRLLTGLEVEETHAPEEHVAEKIAGHYQVSVEKMIENLTPAGTTNGEA